MGPVGEVAGGHGVGQALDLVFQARQSGAVELRRISDDYVDYVKGANIAGFKKVADAMLAFGVV